MGHEYNEGICGKFIFFWFSRGFSCNIKKKKSISKHQTQNSNENNEYEINEKDEETATLDDPITNKTKEVPVVIIDWFMTLKAIR